MGRVLLRRGGAVAIKSVTTSLAALFETGQNRNSGLRGSMRKALNLCEFSSCFSILSSVEFFQLLLQFPNEYLRDITFWFVFIERERGHVVVELCSLPAPVKILQVKLCSKV